MRLCLPVALLLGAGCSPTVPDVLDGAHGSEDGGTTSDSASTSTTSHDATTHATTLDPSTTDPDGTSSGTTGDVPEPPPIDECWEWEVLVDDASRSPAWSLAVLEGLLATAGSPSPGSVGAIALDGTPLWSYRGFAPQFELDLRAVAPRDDGSFVIAGQRVSGDYASGEALWVAELGALGGLTWQAQPSALHFSTWVDVDVRLHPAGGMVVSGHDSLADGDSPRLLTIRLDDAGQTVWHHEHPLPGDPRIADSASMGAMELLPSGDIVQLTAAVEGVRLLRTTADGELVWDQTYATGTYPQDLVALPDGDVLVLSTDIVEADLMRLDADGGLQWEQRYEAGAESILVQMAWDPLTERLVARGQTRGYATDPKQMTTRTWMVVLDGDGAMHWWFVGEPASPEHPLDLVRDPTGSRFYFTEHADALLIGVVQPCGA